MKNVIYEGFLQTKSLVHKLKFNVDGNVVIEKVPNFTKVKNGGWKSTIDAIIKKLSS